MRENEETCSFVPGVFSQGTCTPGVSEDILGGYKKILGGTRRHDTEYVNLKENTAL
jgi:hypothetical protein